MRASVRTAWTMLAVLLALVPTSTLDAQQPPPAAVFRASRDIVSIDVVVRDRSGAIVRGLTAADFELREDGRPQELLTTGFEEVNATVEAAIVDEHGEISHVSPAVSPVSAKRRLAVIRRDGKCRWPGCETRWGLEVHHLRPRSHGGSDDTANLAAVCALHHRRLIPQIGRAHV